MKLWKLNAKSRLLPTLFAASVLLCGCSSGKFTEYHGSAKVIQGKGGTMENIDGVDFWDVGEPGRKYEILGVIHVNHKHLALPGRINGLFSDPDEQEESIARLALKKGGDAVIPARKSQEGSGVGQDGKGRRRLAAKFIVIKYLD